ncbi:N-acetylneuraminate synthase family protein [Halorhodospira neutriphila]|uniref:PseI/NeuA/B-like domain-containing protein n=1 Tax=Halorhodospira neutriphila TaxID=168379 RepID=A0ABS1E574_9GAMM|nr:N-acetylneuraminate synthase family protein [Halorhodospira neutriphila]MBK1725454.1 hypothetical protein [Halorhodospira neutriphila]
MDKIKTIAETAFTHEGNSEYLERLVESALETDVDIVKFQVLISLEYADSHPMASKAESLTFDKDFWKNQFQKVKASGKSLLVLPLDWQALKWVLEEQIADIIEIHAVNLFRRDFYDCLASHKNPLDLVLAISGYTLEEIQFAVKKYSSLKNTSVTLMLGFQSFPTQSEDIGLNRIRQLQQKFSLPIGYADHTHHSENADFIYSASVALGISMLEKHIILQREEERIDCESAVECSELDRIISLVRKTEAALGTTEKYALSREENTYRERRLKLVAVKPIAQGDYINFDNAKYMWIHKSPNKSAELTFTLPFSHADRCYEVGDVLS